MMKINHLLRIDDIVIRLKCFLSIGFRPCHIAAAKTSPNLDEAFKSPDRAYILELEN